MSGTGSTGPTDGGDRSWRQDPDVDETIAGPVSGARPDSGDETVVSPAVDATGRPDERGVTEDETVLAPRPVWDDQTAASARPAPDQDPPSAAAVPPAPNVPPAPEPTRPYQRSAEETVVGGPPIRREPPPATEPASASDAPTAAGTFAAPAGAAAAPTTTAPAVTGPAAQTAPGTPGPRPGQPDAVVMAPPKARPSSPGGPVEFTGLLILRLVLGLGIAAHGAQKLFGWFDGDGLDGTAAFFEQVGFAPGDVTALVGGLCELIGGVLIVLGLFSSVGAAAVTAVMLGAVGVKWVGSDGAYFAGNMGIELEITIAAAALALALVGPGRVSFDYGRFWDRPWARAVVAALGLAGGVVALVLALQ